MYTKTKPQRLFEIKAIAQNEVNPERVVFTCKKVKAQTEIYMDRKKIVKILELMKEFHHAKIVTGKCPDCRELTILVFLADDFYRCVNCGN